MNDSNRLWWQRPNRVLLINLREGDEPRVDAEQLVADAKSFSATAFRISGGGIVASCARSRLPAPGVSPRRPRYRPLPKAAARR